MMMKWINWKYLTHFFNWLSFKIWGAKSNVRLIGCQDSAQDAFDWGLKLVHPIYGWFHIYIISPIRLKCLLFLIVHDFNGLYPRKIWQWSQTLWKISFFPWHHRRLLDLSSKAGQMLWRLRWRLPQNKLTHCLRSLERLTGTVQNHNHFRLRASRLS